MHDLIKKIVASFKDTAAVTDASGKLIYLSHAARRLLGVDGNEDITGRPLHAVLSGGNHHCFPGPENPSEALTTADQHQAGAVLFGNIMAHKAEDGSIDCFSYQLPPGAYRQTVHPENRPDHRESESLNQAGKNIRTNTYQADIPQHVEIQQVLSALAEPVIVYDTSGTPVMANTAAVKMIGFDPVGMPWENFIQKKALLYTSGRPVPFDQLPCKRALDGNAVHSERFIRINAKGEERIYEFNAVALMRDNKITGAVTVARDETESARLMDQLETERTALQAIIHNAPEAIIVVDQECRIVMTNPAARQLAQQSPAGATGSMGPGYDDRSPPYDPVDLPLARSVFRGEMIADHEMAISLPDGQCRHLLVNTAPIRNPRGEVTGAVGVFHDITQRKRQRLELQRARAELEKRVEERTAELRHTVETLREEIEIRKKIENRLQDSQEELRHLSHRMLQTLESDRQKIARELHDSLGASLAAIKFSLEEKLAQMPPDPPDDILSIESIVSYLMTTIKETKRIAANLRPTILDDLGLLPTITWFCREFQSFYQNIRVEEKITIKEEDIDESLKIVIYRILQEAMNNAAKHGNPDTIRLFLKKNENRIELTVADNGNGFDTKDRLDSSDPMSGHGIQGMRERANICGGEFEVLSHPGAGTRIHASLPGRPYHKC